MSQKQDKNKARKRFFIFLILSILILVIIISANKFMIIALCMIFCSATMIYKRYVAIDSLGIDFCLTFILLVSSKYGFFTGMIMSFSYLLGMVLSLDITRNPATTMYGTLFYIGISLLSSLLPLNFVYNAFIVLVIIVNALYMIISLMIGGPIAFLSIYTSTNAFANILLYRFLGGALRLVF